jgi:hypothetical protein
MLELLRNTSVPVVELLTPTDMEELNTAAPAADRDAAMLSLIICPDVSNTAKLPFVTAPAGPTTSPDPALPQAGSPPTIDSTCPVVPMPSLAAVVPPLEYMMSPVVVRTFANLPLKVSYSVLLISPAVTLDAEARGMFSVCVAVELTKAGAVPEEPLAKD